MAAINRRDVLGNRGWEMKEKILYHGIPIVGRMPLFNAEMRQAVRDDRKGQTRRPMDPQPVLVSDAWRWKNIAWGVGGAQISDEFIVDHCPYGKIGDVRCMCEPLMRGATTGVVYYLDDYRLHRPATAAISLITGKPIPWRWKRDTLTSIHMPTEATRTVCRVTDIRVERVQEISEDDARAEGVERLILSPTEIGGVPVHPMTSYYRDAFRLAWDSIYAKHGHGFDVNPWVWVIEFRNVV